LSELTGGMRFAIRLRVEMRHSAFVICAAISLVSPQVQSQHCSSTLSELHQQAFLYARFATSFNQAKSQSDFKYDRPTIENPQLRDLALNGGRAPYWSLPRDTPGLRVIGKSSVLLPTSREVLLFAHPGDILTQNKLKSQFGPPSGDERVRLTSSIRTIVVLPERNGRLTTVPFFLKLDGAWFNPKKRLLPDEAEVAVEKSEACRDCPSFIQEPGAVVYRSPLTGDVFTSIHREFPSGSNVDVRPGERLMPLHALLSSNYWKEFGREQEVFDRIIDELTEPLARMLVENFFDHGLHPMLHAQNIDVLVGADGRVKALFAKDLQDILYDPVVDLLHGRPPKATARMRNGGYLNEVHDHYSGLNVIESSTHWYADYMGSLSYDVARVSLPDDQIDARAALRFSFRVRDKVVSLLQQRIPGLVLPPQDAREWRDGYLTDEYARLKNKNNSTMPIAEDIQSVRDQWVAQLASQFFVPDHAARQYFFERDWSIIHANPLIGRSFRRGRDVQHPGYLRRLRRKHFAASDKSELVAYGYWHGTPTAVVQLWSPSGPLSIHIAVPKR